MKPHLFPSSRQRFFICLLVLTLTLVLAQAAAGQPPAPPVTPPWLEDIKPFHHPLAVETEANSASPALDLGQPGLSFRYVRTFGETETPYFEDTSHLNNPVGLGVAGANVWIVECDGRRALKYTSDGVFLTKIGKGGVSYGTGTTLWCPRDVAIDSSGNVWLVASGEHVAKFDVAGAFVREWGRVWNAGASNDRFEDAQSIAFDNGGNFYVSDSGNHRIQVFNASGDYVTTLGVTGSRGSDNAHFDHPRHIVIDSNNRLYVADRDNHRVQIFDVSALPTMVHLATIGEATQPGSDNTHFDAPQGIAVDVARGRIFVADAGNRRVQVFDYGSRAYQTTLSGFSFIEDVAVDAAGNLYTSEPWSDRHLVQQFDNTLTRARVYGITGVPYRTDGSHYFYPLGVAVAGDGSLYISEEVGRRLIKLSPDGVPIWIVGEPGWWGDDNEHFTYGNDVVLDAAGRVYVTDGANCRVQIFRPDGNYFATLGAGCGANSDQLSRPYGLTVAPNGDIYVADPQNQRIQVFNSSRSHIATLGMTGVATSSNAGFNQPMDVAVDSRGTIYVSDLGNRRIQVFDSSRVYVRTIGATGVSGDDFDRLSSPHHLAIDAHDNLYIADPWGNNRVQVFDKEGAYLTTIDGRFGAQPGQNRGPRGLAVDVAGNVYFADWDNARIQKFAPGTPGWKQVNINGFGERKNSLITALAPFAGHLYAGTYNYSGAGAQLWRMDGGGAWTPIMINGFGDPTNVGVDHLFPFAGQLYAGTWNEDFNTSESKGGEIWRSTDGANWNRVATAGFGDPTNGEVFRFAEFDGQIYATTWSYTDTHGAEIWRSSTGSEGAWSRVVANGFGDAHNRAIISTETMNGYLYAGTYNFETGGEIWRSSDGANWQQVNTDGFGESQNDIITALAAFAGYLYATPYRAPDAGGAQVWRCQICDSSDWQKVEGNGFGDANTRHNLSLQVFAGRLYFVGGNSVTGLQVWRTQDGTHWQQVESAGFGDSNNRYPYFDNSVAVYNDRLFIGSQNGANGGEIWQKTVTADFSASPTIGAPPLVVSFTNASAGDYTSSRWDFGDGQTSTETNPTHPYTNAGAYTVTLTVGDGVDAHTTTRPAFVRATHRLFLPLAMQKHDPMLYDDFDDPAYDGSYDHVRWALSGSSAFTARQQAGALVFTNAAMSAADGAALVMQQPAGRSLRQLQQFEARLKVGPDHVGKYALVSIQISGYFPGHSWWTQCRLGVGSGATKSSFICDVATYDNSGAHFEYISPSVSGAFDTWYTAKIEVDPNTVNLRFYLDGDLVGSYTPMDATALRIADDLWPKVGAWNDGPDTFLTRYVDDVRITPAR